MKIFSWPVSGMMLATCGLLAAQQGNLAGPVAGFVFDGAGRTVRPIQGVPGASLLGDGFGFGMEVSSVTIAPHQDSAFVIAADQSLHFFLLKNGTPSEVSLGGVAGTPERILFSPSGSAAALMGDDSSRILTGLPNTPTLAGTIRVPAFSGVATMSIHSFQIPANIALSDDGAYMLATIQGSARLLSVQGQNRGLLAAQTGALVAFAPGNHDAAVMDSLTGLTFIRDAAGNGTAQLLAVPDDGLALPVGLAFSQDKQTVYVASSTAKSVVAFSLASASRTPIACGCTPTTLIPMGNLFRLNELTGDPLWLLDGTAATPRTVFVPARSE